MSELSPSLMAMWVAATLTIVGVDESDRTRHEDEALVFYFNDPDDRELRQLVDDIVGPHYDGYAPNYELDRTERITEWGASAAVVDVVIAVAETMLAPMVAYALGRALPKRGRRTLDEAEAIEHARWSVATRYDHAFDELEVVSFEQGGDSCVVVLAHVDRRYTATLRGGRNGTVVATQMKWERQ